MKKAIALIMIGALISGCQNPKEHEPLSEQPIKVKTALVKAVSDDQVLGYSGTAEAVQAIPLSFRTAGTVEKVLVDVGDPVRKGQVLATLDDADLQNIYNTTLARYKQAEDAYNRLKQVHDEGSLPEIKWVEMQSNYDQAKSALDLAQNNLDKCKLVAPVNGIVGRRNIEPGQSSINLGGAPIELVKIEKVLVKVSVPENEINKIQTGWKAIMTVAALGGKSYEGLVTNISPIAEVMSRTYTVKISVDNPGLDLKPGMVCDVRMQTGTGETMLVVPFKAVSKDSNGSVYVFLVDQNSKTVRKQPVTAGQYYDSGIEILSGLTAGQVIVSEGAEKLSDNSKISL